MCSPEGRELCEEETERDGLRQPCAGRQPLRQGRGVATFVNMRPANRVGIVVFAIGATSVAVSGLLATLASRPKLAAKVFGGEPNPRQHPTDVGLEAIDVEYSQGSLAWWVPAPGAAASVVVVHGFETAEDPRATDPGPRLELAVLLHEAEFNCLIISLGYGTGAHLHSGGALEAQDIVAAVKWAAAHGGVPVAVFGFSAGGHAAVAASASIEPFAVITDSSFVDFGEVVVDQGAEVLPVPPLLFAPVRFLMRLMTGLAPVNLEKWEVNRRIPMLHIHSETDQAIDFGNLDRMAAVTGGEVLHISGADHIDALRTEPQRYAEAVVSFLQRSLAAFPAAGERP